MVSVSYRVDSTLFRLAFEDGAIAAATTVIARVLQEMPPVACGRSQLAPRVFSFYRFFIG